jgi:fermentation-respiration switch protein FrsA (DUF1100 family)
MSSWSATTASVGVGNRNMTVSPIVLTSSSSGPSTSLGAGAERLDDRDGFAVAVDPR